MQNHSIATRKLFALVAFLLLFVIAKPSLFSQNSLPGNFQPGYVINLTGDTLYGYISRATGGSAYFQCRFMAEPGDPVQTFGPADIAGYGIENDIIYHSINLDLATFFNHIEYDIMQIQASEEVMRILHIMQKNADNPDFDMAELLKRDESEPPLSQPVFLRLLLKAICRSIFMSNCPL